MRHGAVAVGFVATVLAYAPAWASFDFASVQAAARELANQPYQKPADDLPPALASLTHAQYQSIAYAAEARLWGAQKTPFSVGFMARGNHYQDSVKINVVNASGVHAVAFNPDDFSFGDLDLDVQTRAAAGFSGLMVRFDLPQGMDGDASPSVREQRVLAFQGAGFFFGLQRGQTEAGANARGLALDTGLMSGEEFPHFTEFWIESPAAGNGVMVVHALLDSRRATGAYRFAIHPGPTLRVEVRARIYLRDTVTVLGLAPLDSMYFYGENDRAHDPGDYRPEMHDSDGLQIQSGSGEWIWRPLLNPKRMLATSFAMTDPRGFGLMQRDHDFTNYQDLTRRFDQSPSIWVTPRGHWGSGRVELVLLPTPDATNNNVVALWVPDTVPKPQQPFDFAYDMQWQGSDAQVRPPASWVTQTRVYPIATSDKSPDIGLVVDFEGPALAALAPDVAVTGVVAGGENGKVVAQDVVSNDATGGRRLLLQIRRADKKKPVELRAYLRTPDDTVSETWSYIVPGEE